MLTHYGLFWSERDVFWGRPNVRGEMRGRLSVPLDRRGAPTTAERNNSTDFRDYVGLYCLYGDGILLYVGEAGLKTAGTLFSRLKQHRKGPMAGRWNKFSWFGRPNSVGTTDNSTALQQLEAVTIAIVNPGFNKQSGTFKDADQVFQIEDHRADGDIESKLNRILTKISAWDE